MDIDSLIEDRKARFITIQTLVPWVVGVAYLEGTRYEIKQGRLAKEHLVEERSLRFAFPLKECPSKSLPYASTARQVIKDFRAYLKTSNHQGKSLLKAAHAKYQNVSLQRFGLLDLQTDTGATLFSDAYYLNRWIHKRWADTLSYIQRHLPEDIKRLAPTWYTSEEVDQIEKRVQTQRTFRDQDYVFAGAASTEQELFTENYYFALWFIYHGNLITWYTLTRFFDHFLDQQRSNQHNLRSSVYWTRTIPKWNFLSKREKAIAVLEYYLQETLNANLTVPGLRWDRSFRFCSGIDQELALLIHIRFRTCSSLFVAVIELVSCFITANIVEPLVLPRRVVHLLESDSDSDTEKDYTLIQGAAILLEDKLPLAEEHFWYYTLGKIYTDHILPYLSQSPYTRQVRRRFA